MSKSIDRDSRMMVYLRRFFPPEREPDALFRRLAEALVTPDASDILDAGCGRNPSMLSVKERSRMIVGIDRREDDLRHNSTIQYPVCAELHELPFRAHTFDVVIARWVFEFIEEPAHFLFEVKRVLKPGGILIFVTLNRGGWQYRFSMKLVGLFRGEPWRRERLRAMYGEELTSHELLLRANRLKTLERLLRQAGLTPRQIILAEGVPVLLSSRMGGFVARLVRRYNRLRGWRTAIIVVCEPLHKDARSQ